MDVFKSMAAYAHEQLVLCHEPSCGYFGIIAIHDTTLGPALGGTRFWQYASTDDAITDALRLARGMSYKSAVAGLNLGGGKSVIVGDNKRKDREALFRAHGRFIETLKGRYITAEDVGTSPADMEFVRMETQSVAGLHGRSGDPSPVTAYGVYVGMKASAKHRWGSRLTGGQAGPGPGMRQRRPHSLRPSARRRAPSWSVTDIDAEKVKQVVQDDRRRGGSARCDLRCDGRHLFAQRAGRHDQRRDAEATQGRGHRRRRQQPAGRGAPRRRARAARYGSTPPTT